MKHISLPFTEESALGLNGLGRSKCAPAPRLGGLQHAHTATGGVCSPPPQTHAQPSSRVKHERSDRSEVRSYQRGTGEEEEEEQAGIKRPFPVTVT